MGIFRRTSTDQSTGFVPQAQALARQVVEAYLGSTGSQLDGLTRVEKEVLAVYLFGVANGLPDDVKQDALHVQTGMIAVLVSVLGLPILKAQRIVEETIASIVHKDPQDTIYAIAHHGLDGYYLLKDDQMAAVVDDVRDMISKLS